MKKVGAIFGITIAGLIVVALLAASAVVWFVFTPARLTPMVRQVAQDYITCPHTIGDVELTFFSTFPQFGLAIDGLYLINPTDGAPSDTLLAAPKVVAKINLQALWKNNAIIVDEVELKNVSATLFTDSLGNSNYNVFVTDTTTTEEDESDFSVPFDVISLQKINLHAAHIEYIDKQSKIEASLHELITTMECRLTDGKGAGTLSFGAAAVSCIMDQEAYLNSAAMQLELPFYADLNQMHLQLKEASVGLNQFKMNMAGTAQVAKNNDIDTDFTFSLKPCQIEALLGLLPPSLAATLADIKVDGTLVADGTVKGTYSDTEMPLIEMNMEVTDGTGKYAALPYKLYDVNGKILMHLNMNDSLASYVNIDRLQAKTGKSSFRVVGTVERLMSDMLCNLTIGANLNLPELAPMMPNGMNVKMQGRANGEVKTKFTMSQLDAMAVEKMNITGRVAYTDLDVVYEDSMLVKSNKGTLHFTIPNAKATQKGMRFLAASMVSDQLHMQQGKSLTTLLTQTKLNLETSNLVADERYLSANCTFDVKTLNATFDNMVGDLYQPKGKAYMKMNMKDTTATPTIQMELAMERLKGSMDTMSVEIGQPRAKVALTGTQNDKQQPRLRIDYNSASIVAQMGADMRANAGALTLIANAQQNAKEKDMLLQWNPHLQIELQNGEVEVSDLPEILIPNMAFHFDRHEFGISNSLFKLGNSDFTLTGKAENIGEWLNNEGLLRGEFNFTSELTDVNELMALTSGFGETADSTGVVEEKTPQPIEEANPYMVPKGVDLILHTNIDKVLVGGQVATNVGGNLYVQDGVLTLEEIGFICEAAKMQLNATYKTPRKNHLYLGFIYHMVDVHIEELASLFPEVIEMVPMLSSFKGQGQFHIAAETYTDAFYNPKISTLRGACSIQGRDLVLMDGETFTEISKMLRFNKKTENKIDTLYAEMAVFKDKIDVYPLLITMDKYQAALGGNHYLSMDFDYHVSLLKPLRIGVDVGGNMDDLKIKLTKCKYAEDFRPKKTNVVETQNERLRKIIRESLNRTMTIESKR